MTQRAYKLDDSIEKNRELAETIRKAINLMDEAEINEADLPAMTWARQDVDKDIELVEMLPEKIPFWDDGEEA